jgi:hypothetical protein
MPLVGHGRCPLPSSIVMDDWLCRNSQTPVCALAAGGALAAISGPSSVGRVPVVARKRSRRRYFWILPEGVSVRHLDGVRVPQLMRREPTPDASFSGGVMQLLPRG